MLHKRKRIVFDGAKKCAAGDYSRKPSQTFTKHLLHSKSTYFYRWGSIVPSVCGMALLLGVGIMINPAVSTSSSTSFAGSLLGSSNGSAHAADNDKPCQNGEPVNGACVEEVGLLMNGTNAPYSEAHATDLYTDKTAYREYDFSVRAVDVADYILYANPVERTVGEISYTNKLVNMDDPEGSIIEALTTKTVGSNIEAGYWGYALAGGNTGNLLTAAKESLEYQALPEGGPNVEGTKAIDTGTETILNADKSHNDVEYKLYFGARAKDTMRSGHYTTEVQLSLVASPKSIIKTMQEFAVTGACATMSQNQSIQLVDDRSASGAGQKIYWVAKLKDGNCWMTQNLDLDIPATGLKAADTAVTSDWTGGTYGPQATKTGSINSGWTWTKTDVQSWDPGMYVYVNPSASLTSCGTSQANLDTCSTYWQKLDDAYIAATTTSMATNVTSTINNKTYDAHYLVGNYYSWNAATAGTGGTIISGQAGGSICPKGWKLPTSGADNTNKGSFGGLFVSTAENITDSNYILKIRQYPVFFPPAGNVTANGLSYAAEHGYWWSSTAWPNVANAYTFYYSSNSFHPFGDGNRDQGRSVRCLVEG